MQAQSSVEIMPPMWEAYDQFLADVEPRARKLAAPAVLENKNGSSGRGRLYVRSGERQAIFELRAGSVLNPFARGVLREFKCPNL